MIGDQTSVFLTAVALGADVMKYPSGIVILGRFAKAFVVPTDIDERIQAQLSRLQT